MTTSKNESIKEFTVALLIENMEEAKSISSMLREFGVFAHFYQSLDEYWVAINTFTPDLSIIDVKCMSMGSSLLQDHPKVKNKKLSVCFYYNEKSKVLLGSTYHFLHEGYLKKELNLKGQLAAILQRRNQIVKLERETSVLTDRIERLQKRSTTVLKDAKLAHEFRTDYESLVSRLHMFHEVNGLQSFMKTLVHYFSDWSECEKFTIYELSKTKQKLISPKSNRSKFKELPSLWLGQVCEHGMKDFAIDMAEQVALDQIGNSVRTICLTGKFQNPDIIIIGQFKEKNIPFFQWDLLERELSGSYRKTILDLHRDFVDGNTFLGIWDTMSLLDDIHYHQVAMTHKLMVIDLKPLIKVIQEKATNRFYYKDFYNDFIFGLFDHLKQNCKISEYGVEQFLVFVENDLMEDAFKRATSFISKFDYYRYFEDSSLVLTKKMYPELKMIAPSAVNFLRSRNGEQQISSESFEMTHHNARTKRTRGLLRM